MDPKTIDLIQAVTYLIPIAALIWKAAQQAAEVKEIRKDLEENIHKFCTKHEEMNQRIEDERRATDSLSISMMNSLHKIELTVTEIKTKIDIKSNKDADIKEE